MASVLIAGCGYVGIALGTRLVEEGHVVWGLRRRIGSLPASIGPIKADLTVPETLRAFPAALEFVFYTAAADRLDDDAYRAIYVDGLRNLLDALDSHRPRVRRVFFTSSTAVYAQSFGEWVDEASPTEPEGFSGRRLLEGERLLRRSGFPSTVLRLGGIYGPGRTRLLESARQGIAVSTEGPPVYANRIHRDDCAGALHHLMMLENPDHLYIGVDHEPADEYTVYHWLAVQLGIVPSGVERPSGPVMRQARSNKRCHNDKLVASGYVFRFPTFRDGYLPLLARQEPGM